MTILDTAMEYLEMGFSVITVKNGQTALYAMGTISKVLEKGLKLYTIGTGMAKTVVMGRLNVEEPEGIGGRP